MTRSEKPVRAQPIVAHAECSCRPGEKAMITLRWREERGSPRCASHQAHGSFTAQRVPCSGLVMAPLGGFARMLLLSRHKDGRLIASVLLPDGKDDPDPDIGESAQRHGMALAFVALALIVVPGPRLALGALPGELLQGVAQWFDTAQPPMGFGVLATLKEDRRGSAHRLDTGGSGIAVAIIADFREQAWGQTLARPWQATEEVVVRMGQKKGADLLVVGRNLRHQRLELGEERQHQPRLRANGDRISHQLRVRQGRLDRGGSLGGRRMPRILEQRGELLGRGARRGLRGRIRLQERQAGGLVQLTEEVQGHGIIRLEARRQLVDQPRLHLDQAILIAGERFQFGHDLAIGLELPQVRKVSASRLGKQVGINQIGLGTRGGPMAIHGARIDRIDRPTRFQQGGNQQPMRRLNDASHLFFGGCPADLLQKAGQLGQSFRAMGDTNRADAMALLIEHQRIVMAIGPINSNIPHRFSPGRQASSLSWRVLILWRSQRDSLIIAFTQEQRRGSTSFLNRSSRVAGTAFPRPVQRFTAASLPLAFALCREGLLLV